MAGRPGRPPANVRPATGRQVYRLSEQGCLGIVIGVDTFLPGGPPDGWTPILHGDAAALLDRLRAERWVGLGRWPEPGESWVVRDGLVVPTKKKP